MTTVCIYRVQKLIRHRKIGCRCDSGFSATRALGAVSWVRASGDVASDRTLNTRQELCLTREDATALRMDGRRLEAISHDDSRQGLFGEIMDDSGEHLLLDSNKPTTY